MCLQDEKLAMFGATAGELIYSNSHMMVTINGENQWFVIALLFQNTYVVSTYGIGVAS